MNKNYQTDNAAFVVYKDWEEYLKMLSAEEVGRLFMAVFAYVKRGEEPDFGGAMAMLFTVMKTTLDRDGKKWESTCAARSHPKKAKDTIAANAAKDTDTDTDNDTVTDTDTASVPRAAGRRPAGGSASRDKNNKNKKSNESSSEHSYDLDKLIAHAMAHTPTLKKDVRKTDSA